VPPTAPHVPFAFVPVFTQLPVQHWPFWKQMSPNCVQYEADVQTPLLQEPEQQSAFPEQPFPTVRQVPPGLIGAHLLFVQMPLQH
jgi:hypothetical protein